MNLYKSFSSRLYYTACTIADSFYLYTALLLVIFNTLTIDQIKLFPLIICALNNKSFMFH